MSIVRQTRQRKRTEVFSNPGPFLFLFFKLNLNFTYVKAWGSPWLSVTLSRRDALPACCVPSAQGTTSTRNPMHELEGGGKVEIPH